MKYLITAFALAFSVIVTAQVAKDIVRKSELNVKGAQSTSSLEIRTVRPTWERNMSAKTWSKGMDQNIILITSPARDKGTVFLKRDKEIWNYVPTIERSVKLPPSMMMQSWMGTDFSNDDLVNESSNLNDYSHKIIDEVEVEGLLCWVVEFTPLPEAPVVWGKIINYISKGSFLQMKGEFYDEDGYLINTMQGFDIKELNGRTLPTRIRMTPAEEPGHYTEMVYKELNFDATLTDSFFSIQNMKRLR